MTFLTSYLIIRHADFLFLTNGQLIAGRGAWLGDWVLVEGDGWVVATTVPKPFTVEDEMYFWWI